MVKDETELAALEEHILVCESCAMRAADEVPAYVDAMRSAALEIIEPSEGSHSSGKFGQQQANSPCWCNESPGPVTI